MHILILYLTIYHLFTSFDLQTEADELPISNLKTKEQSKKSHKKPILTSPKTIFRKTPYSGESSFCSFIPFAVFLLLIHASKSVVRTRYSLPSLYAGKGSFFLVI